MRKIISLLLAVAMVCVLFAGCGNAGKSGADDDDRETVSADVDEETSEAPEVSTDTPATSGIPSSGSPAADSYTAYTTAKTAVVTRLSDGLSSNDEYALTSLALLGPIMIDLAFLPVAISGLGEEAAIASLGFFNAANVRYSESGNTYTLSYTVEEQNDEGAAVSVAYEFISTYDPAANALASTASKDGVPALYMEYHQTSFGWVGQYATIAESDEDTFDIIYIVVQGEDGAVGMGESATMPAPLTGSESADFVKTLPAWFAINGNMITGLSDGKPLSFEYTPQPSAS